MADIKEQRICIRLCCNLGKLGSETCEMLQKAFEAFVMMPWVDHKPLNGMYFKENNSWLRILNGQIEQH